MSKAFQKISQRIFDKPNSIEDLTEQREFMKTVPDLVAAHLVRATIRTLKYLEPATRNRVQYHTFPVIS